MPTFVEELPGLLRQLSDPVTPHTAAELWCRIQALGWEPCVSVLRRELQSGNSDVKRLVLAILSEEVEQVGTDSVQAFLVEVEQLLADEDRLVRVAAIHAVRDLHLTTPTAIESLRQIICNDEPPIAREALVTLLELDERVVTEIASMLRERTS